MLIALLITALIGIALFSTYRNVTESRKSAQALVESQEHPRLFRAVLDDDIGSMLTEYDRRLPLLSRQPILVGEAYRKAAPRDLPEEKSPEDETLLFSFATGAGLNPSGGSSATGLYCVEYRLRGREREQAFIRRERPHCGVDGLFEWDEYVLLPSVYRLVSEVWPMGGEGWAEDWQSMRSSEDVPRAIRFSIWHTAEDSFPEVLIITLPDRITEKEPS